MPGKAARYERVSTSQQAEQGTSLETQAAHNLETCLQLGFDPDEVYHRVEDASGADRHRPGFLALQGWVEKREVAAVVIYDTDRLARDPLDVLTFIRLCKANLVQLHFSCGRSVETAEDECLEFLRGYFGLRERQKIMQRTIEGKLARAAQGYMPCGNPHGTYGYDKDPVTRKLVINEEEAIWVLQMHQWSADAVSPYAIANRLDALGVRTKTGCRWVARTVKAVLVNTTYKGESYYGKTRQQVVNGKRVTIAVPREEWILVPDYAPPIVPRALWEKVQENWSNARTRAEINLWDYFLTRHVFCVFCGRRMTGSTQKDQYGLYPYYGCSGTRSRNNPGGGCTASMIRADFLEPAVWDHVVAAVRDPSAVIADLRRNWETGTGELARLEAKLKREVENCRNQEKLLLRQYSREVIDEATLDELLDPVKALRSRHERDLHKIREQAEIANSLDDVDGRIRACFEDYAARLESISSEERRALLNRLNVRVVADKERALVTAELDPDLFTTEHTSA